MLPQEKHIRRVIKGCFERGVQVSEELAHVFVSVRCNQLLYYTYIDKYKICRFYLMSIQQIHFFITVNVRSKR